MIFEAIVDDAHPTINLAHHEPMAQVSKKSYLFFVPCLFEEKRRDLVFAFASFAFAPYRSTYIVGATPPTVL